MGTLAFIQVIRRFDSGPRYASPALSGRGGATTRHVRVPDRRPRSRVTGASAAVAPQARTCRHASLAQRQRTRLVSGWFPVQIRGGARGRPPVRFDLRGRVAQLAEQQVYTLSVAGSTPAAPTASPGPRPRLSACPRPSRPSLSAGAKLRPCRCWACTQQEPETLRRSRASTGSARGATREDGQPRVTPWCCDDGVEVSEWCRVPHDRRGEGPRGLRNRGLRAPPRTSGCGAVW